jgi:hypothetical protein
VALLVQAELRGVIRVTVVGEVRDVTLGKRCVVATRDGLETFGRLLDERRLVALQAGDVEKAQGFANDTVTGELGQITGAFDQFNTLLDQYNATDETREKYTNIIPLIVKAVFEKYEITGTEKVSDTAYSFTVKNTGVNLDAIEHVDAALDQDAFVDGITEELQEKAKTDGYDAAMSWMLDKLADYMLESLNTYIADQSREDTVLNCVVEKVDDQWLVTKMQ